MYEEEPNAASAALSRGETPGEAPEKREPGDAPLPASPPAPVNKVHEWMAAAVIVVFLTLILVGFVVFMRGVSI